MTLRGTVFTPATLARRLVAGLGPGPVLDPACGEGELLLAALEQSGDGPGAAVGGLFGLELQPELAERTRERLRTAAGLPAGGPLDGQIVCADALCPATDWPAGTWIAANPPWVSFSGREAERRSKREQDAFRQRWASAGGWPTLQGAFLERIARHVAAEGTGARVLVPAALTALPSYGPLRESVTRHCALSSAPEELAEDAFEGVVGPATILTLSPGGTPSAGPWSPEREPELLDALAAHPRLPERTFADPGVHTGNAAAELVVREPAPDLPGVREGRCLDPFRLGPPVARLRTDLERTAERRFRIAPLEHYQAFPVLLRQTADRPIAALHLEPTYFRNSLLAARAVPGLDPAYVTAVLNGPVARAWHRARFADARQRTFPQVKVAHLAGQPFPIVHRDQDPAGHDELAGLARAAGQCAPGSDDYEAACEQLGRATLRAFGLARGLERRLLCPV
jgi:hypothetical protein